MLVYILVDIKIVKHSKFHFVVFCFMSSRSVHVYWFVRHNLDLPCDRLSALVHVLINSMSRGSLLFSAFSCHNWHPHPEVFPTNDWALLAMYITSACMGILSMMMSSFLFLQRVLAIYHEEKWVRRCFCFLWAINLPSLIMVAFGGRPTQTPGTNDYQDDDIKPWVSLSLWLILLFDTAVLLATSYKIVFSFNTAPASQGVSWFNLLTGRTLPRLSRSIFRGGQQYYL